MIKEAKSVNVPKSLIKTKSYDGEDVQKQLLEDHHKKCYICEGKVGTGFQIEHHKSKENYPELKQEWTNLFLSCSYCNGRKKHLYDSLLNPLNTEIENIIKHEWNALDKVVTLTPLEVSDEVSKTIELLSKLFNGKKAKMRNTKENEFYELFQTEMNTFNKHIVDFLSDPSSNEAKCAIKQMLSIDSTYLGFKYWIIQSNTKLKETFSNDIVWNKNPTS